MVDLRKRNTFAKSISALEIETNDGSEPRSGWIPRQCQLRQDSSHCNRVCEIIPHLLRSFCELRITVCGCSPDAVIVILLLFGLLVRLPPLFLLYLLPGSRPILTGSLGCPGALGINPIGAIRVMWLELIADAKSAQICFGSINHFSAHIISSDLVYTPTLFQPGIDADM